MTGDREKFARSSPRFRLQMAALLRRWAAEMEPGPSEQPHASRARWRQDLLALSDLWAECTRFYPVVENPGDRGRPLFNARAEG